MKSNPILIQLGLNIKAERNKQRFSQEQLSFASKLDRSYVGGVERGERNISVLNLCKIASALGTTPSFLLNGVDQTTPPPHE
jgi:transcriptional regulator with XRE-family HTH domain